VNDYEGGPGNYQRNDRFEISGPGAGIGANGNYNGGVGTGKANTLYKNSSTGGITSE
jgi:hypothetical protein